MTTVAYTSPLVPPEWIAACGMEPRWLRLRSTNGRPLAGLRRGACPYASALIRAARSKTESSALILTTTCDQMRYAAALIDHERTLPAFLMNVPSTWQTDAARRLYLEELRRLGRFLAGLGGKAPSPDDLIEIMAGYDRARTELRAARDRLSGRRFAEAVAELRGSGRPALDGRDSAPCGRNVPLAVVGGPMLDEDYRLFDVVEQCGGRVVLDATECGERTLPRPFDPKRVQDDPLAELADAYFGSIPGAFRRPNHPLYQWLRRELAARGVRGILFRRYVWCDLWHAELHRLKKRSPLAVLDIDAGDQDESAASRTLGRIEAFLETLT